LSTTKQADLDRDDVSRNSLAFNDVRSKSKRELFANSAATNSGDNQYLFLVGGHKLVRAEGYPFSPHQDKTAAQRRFSRRTHFGLTTDKERA